MSFTLCINYKNIYRLIKLKTYKYGDEYNKNSKIIFNKNNLILIFNAHILCIYKYI